MPLLHRIFCSIDVAVAKEKPQPIRLAESVKGPLAPLAVPLCYLVDLLPC